MKTIFVTIGEFLVNGGKLAIGRPIYFLNSSGTEYIPIGVYAYNDEGNIVVATDNAEFPYFTASFLGHCVQIEVTPIWK